MIDSIIKDRCTGCEGCASVCPTKCIDMVQNYEGFFMPQQQVLYVGAPFRRVLYQASNRDI